MTFLVNVWLNHRPQQAQVFPKAHISRFGASLSAQRASAFTGVVGSGNAESAVPTVSLRALLRSSKKTPLDLHRWYVCPTKSNCHHELTMVATPLPH